MLDAIAKPFGWLMMGLYELTGNFGVATILFSLCVTLVLLPFMAKSKKSMMRMTRLQPRMMELQKKHEGNPQKLNEEMARLYREEKVSPMGRNPRPQAAASVFSRTILWTSGSRTTPFLPTFSRPASN